jgi:predicted Zn-dependent protease
MKVALLFAAVSAALAQQPGQGVNFYSVEKEISLGNQMAAKMQSSTNARPDARLQSIGDKLAAHADGPYQYRFFVYTANGKPLEPVAIPGGPVFTAESLASPDDTETAAILAHAIAHIALRTYTRAATRGDLMQIGQQASQIALESSGNGNAPQIRPNNSTLSYARFAQGFELACDLYAVKLMTAAGYDPHALVRWLETLPKPKGAEAMTSPYPAPAVRIDRIEKAIAAAH